MSALTLHEPIDQLPEQLSLFPSTNREIKEAGLYFDIPFSDYASIPALNQSILKLVISDSGSPKHARAAFDGKMKFSSDTLRLGRAEHCWIIEGEQAFREQFEVATDCVATITSKSSKRCGQECGSSASCKYEGQWYCKTHAPKSAEKPTDYIGPDRERAIRRMCESVRSHEIAQHFTRPGWTEGVIVYDVPVKFATQWKDKDGNPRVERHNKSIRHKIRFDKLGKPTKARPHIVLDLKRMPVLKGARRTRERAIEDYGWDVQAAMYTEAVMAHYGVESCDYVWVFVEESEPHDVVWFPASEDTLRIGRDKLWRARQQWAICEQTGDWPGRCVGDQWAGGLSSYAAKKYFQEFADSEGRLASEIVAKGM